MVSNATAAAALTDNVTSYTFTEIALYKRGGLYLIPPPASVVNTQTLTVGVVSGDGTGVAHSR